MSEKKLKEIVVISGKGGTGKTSLSLALLDALSQNKKIVAADCDVDAADMHLVLSPEIEKSEVFISGNFAHIQQEKCSRAKGSSCSVCYDLCRFDSIKKIESSEIPEAKSASNPIRFSIGENDCEGCMLCVEFCPEKAIVFPERKCGKLFVSKTRFAPLVHAALDIGSENSGKLVTEVRKKAKSLAEETNSDYLIVDGSPGIGCPVIASITGADQVLIVTEPTLSGMSDLKRVAGLVKHFKIPHAVIVNKATVNLDISREIESWCSKNKISYLGEIHYNKNVTLAQLQEKTIIEYEKEEVEKPFTSFIQKIIKDIL